MHLRRWLRRLLPAALLAFFGLALARARDRARDIPFSPVVGDRYVGPDFPERRGLTTGESPVGEMDDMAAFDRDPAADRTGFDADAVDPAVRDFYERTSAYAMAYRTRWHRGFRLGAALAAPLTSRIEQLNLPGPADERVHRLRSRFARLRPDADPREEPRAWVRTDPETAAAVFVALYASHVDRGGDPGDAGTVGSRDGDVPAPERFVNIAAPLPATNLSTILRLRHLPATGDESGGRRGGESDGPRGDESGGRRGAGTGDADTGVELTTWCDGDPGLYLVTPLGTYELPLEQRFRVRAVDASADVSPDPVDPRATLVASHEMWLLGRQFLTIEYAMWPDQASTSTS